MILKDAIESPKSLPQKYFLKFLNGEHLSFKQSIYAKCFECTNGFIDGRQDCLVNDCPLYPYMPYNPNKTKKRTGGGISNLKKMG